MKARKFVLCCCLCLILAVVFAGCRNNLANEWETYTGDTNVYYTPPTEASETESAETESTTTEATEADKIVTEYGIPEYWNDELLSVVDESLDAIADAGENRTTFLWYTDAHLSYSARQAVPILRFLQEQTEVQYINFGGDIVSDNTEVAYEKIVAQLNDWREATLTLHNHHSVVGNHDDDIEEFADRSDLYAFLLSEEVNKVTDSNNQFCYYVDNSAEKTRYIYLSTGFDNTSDDDLRFLVSALNSTQENWHIVVVSHIWFSYTSTETPTEGVVPEFAQVILNVLDAYNERKAGAEREVAFDFSVAKARVEFCIGGHTHVDFEFYTDGGIPVVLTETASYHLRRLDKDITETNETSVNVIVADYSENCIHIIRAGRGESRTVPLSQP